MAHILPILVNTHLLWAATPARLYDNFLSTLATAKCLPARTILSNGHCANRIDCTMAGILAGALYRSSRPA